MSHDIGRVGLNNAREGCGVKAPVADPAWKLAMPDAGVSFFSRLSCLAFRDVNTVYLL
jgi:hypothetical protein